MFYLTTHSTHFIYGYMASGNRKRNQTFKGTISWIYMTFIF